MGEIMAAEKTWALKTQRGKRGHLGALVPLLEVSETLLSEVEIERLYELILDIVQRETHADVVSLMLLDGKKQELSIEAAVGLSEEVTDSTRTKVGEGIAGWVIQQGKPLLLADGAPVDPSIREAMQREEVTSALCLPLKIKGRVIGALNASKMTPESPFNYHDLELLSVLASQVAIAIENSRVHEATRNRTRQLAALNELSRVVISTLDLDEVLRLAIRGINKIIGVEAGSLLLLDETTNELIFRMTLYGDAQKHASAKLQVGQGIAGWVVKEGKPRLVPEVDAEPRYHKDVSEHLGLVCRSILCVPLVIRDHVIGAIELMNKVDGDFTNEDLKLLDSMAATVAIALENARLYTELAEFVLELEKSQDQLIRAGKLTATGKLAASLAHEINNPLQAIQNCLHLVMRKSSLDEHKRQAYLAMAQEEVQRLIDLVERMLDFSRPSEEGRAPVDIKAIVDDVLSLAGKRLQQAKVVVHEDATSPLPLVEGTSSLLKQVFLNIIINASEAMPSGGDLYIDTAGDEKRGEVSISFTDTGEGIPVAELASIFDPFYTTKARGTGLGLSISHTIIERHGGRIDVRSELGKGSTFVVRLPTSSEGAEETWGSVTVRSKALDH
jgi:signal transduction histidine kinase/RNase P/RNase MRP subunit p29